MYFVLKYVNSVIFSPPDKFSRGQKYVKNKIRGAILFLAPGATKPRYAPVLLYLSHNSLWQRLVAIRYALWLAIVSTSGGLLSKSRNLFVFCLSQVMVVLLDHAGADLVTLVFNATGSNSMSWFSADRLISSPYDDILSESHNFFSIKGWVWLTFSLHFFTDMLYCCCCFCSWCWWVFLIFFLSET